MNQISFLLLFPLAPALLLAFISNQTVRNLIVWVSSLALIFVSLSLATAHLGTSPEFFSIDSPVLEKLFFAGEIILSLYLLWRCRGSIKKSRTFPCL